MVIVCCNEYLVLKQEGNCDFENRMCEIQLKCEGVALTIICPHCRVLCETCSPKN